MWVFGCYLDKFADNSKYLFLQVALKQPGINPVWVTSDVTVRDQLCQAGYPVLARWSLRGIYACLRAGVYCYSSYLDEINFYTSGNALKVNLWHGIGLKKIEFKIKTGKLKKYFNPAWWNPYRILLPEKFVRPDLFLSTSAFMTEHFSECFRIPQSRCIEATYPRLSFAEQPELWKAALAFGNYDAIENALSRYDQNYLYMPTWRDYGAAGIEMAIPDFVLLNNLLRKKRALLTIKLHPVDARKMSHELSNIQIWPNDLDIYPVLARFDCLITDYSSILYDFIVLSNAPVLLYVYDYKDYLGSNRDLAYPFDENTTGKRIENFNELCNFIIQGNLQQDCGNRYKVRDKFWSLKMNQQHLIDVISAKS